VIKIKDTVVAEGTWNDDDNILGLMEKAMFSNGAIFLDKSEDFSIFNKKASSSIENYDACCVTVTPEFFVSAAGDVGMEFNVCDRRFNNGDMIFNIGDKFVDHSERVADKLSRFIKDTKLYIVIDNKYFIHFTDACVPRYPRYDKTGNWIFIAFFDIIIDNEKGRVLEKKNTTVERVIVAEE